MRIAHTLSRILRWQIQENKMNSIDRVQCADEEERKKNTMSTRVQANAQANPLIWLDSVD